MMLAVPVTAGFAQRDAVSARPAGVPESATHAQAQGVRAEKEKKPELEVPKAFYLVPADKQKGEDLREAQGHLAIGEKNLGKGDEEEQEFGKLTADIGDLSAKVRIKEGDACKLDGKSKVSCSILSGYNAAPPDFELRALKTGRIGDSGTMRYTYTSPGGQVVKASTRVVIGRPLMAVEQLPRQERTKLGDEVSFPLRFKNVGEGTADGIVVAISGKVEPSAAKRHSNCRYKAGVRVTTCSFPDARVRPGEVWTMKPAPSVRFSLPELYEKFDYKVAPIDDPDFSGTSGGPEPQGGEPGEGSAVRLVKSDKEGGRFWTGEEEPSKTFLMAQQDTHMDYEAIATSHPSAKAGEAIRVRVGVRNKGPGTFGSQGVLGNPGAVVKVTIPSRTKVIHAPREMNHVGEYDQLCTRHGRTYTCKIDAPERGDADTSLEFLLRVHESDKLKVELPDEPLPRRDPDPSNDTMALKLSKTKDDPTVQLIVTFGTVAVGGVLVWTRRRWMPLLRRDRTS